MHTNHSDDDDKKLGLVYLHSSKCAFLPIESGTYYKDGGDDDDAFLDGIDAVGDGIVAVRDGIVDVGDGLVIRLQSQDHIGSAQSTREYSIFDIIWAWWSCLNTKTKTR